MWSLYFVRNPEYVTAQDIVLLCYTKIVDNTPHIASFGNSGYLIKGPHNYQESTYPCNCKRGNHDPTIAKSSLQMQLQSAKSTPSNQQFHWINFEVQSHYLLGYVAQSILGMADKVDQEVNTS